MKRKISIFAVAAAMGLCAASAFAQETAAQRVAPSPVASEAAGITAGQRARLNEKLSMAARLLAQMESGAKAEGLSAGWRQAAMNTLYALSNETLSSLGNVTSPSQLPKAVAMAKRAAPKALGDSTQDLVYTPITPCRYIDTRNVGGPINGTRSYDFDVNSYGGNCPNDPYGLFGGTLGAIAANVAIVAPSTAPGFATIVPVGTSPSVALVNWYESGAAVQASNAAIITNDQGGTLAEVDIFTSSTVHVIVDIFGAFRAPQATALQCVSTFVQNTTIAGNATFDISIPACPAGYTMTGAGCRTPGFHDADWAINGLYKTSAGATIDAFCSGRNATAGTITVQGTAQCCRTPGR